MLITLKINTPAADMEDIWNAFKYPATILQDQEVTIPAEQTTSGREETKIIQVEVPNPQSVIEFLTSKLEKIINEHTIDYRKNNIVTNARSAIVENDIKTGVTVEII
jgi:hypothetical protein